MLSVSVLGVPPFTFERVLGRGLPRVLDFTIPHALLKF